MSRRAEKHSQDNAQSVDYLTTVVGFGMCRAWIIACIAAPLMPGVSMASSWIYLVFGAATALFISYVVRWLEAQLSRMRVLLLRGALCSIVSSGLVIQLAYHLHAELLLACGFSVGGVGAGILQVLWGEQFALRPARFAELASPAAAIVTAVAVVATSAAPGIVGFAAVPAFSFVLLAYEARRAGFPVGEIFGCKCAGAHGGPDATAQDSGGDEAGTAPTPPAPEPEPSAASAASAGRPDFAAGKLMLSIMVFSLLCRLFDYVPSDPDPLGFMGGSVMCALVLTGSAFMLMVALLRDRFDAALTYRLSLPVMVTGYALIALTYNRHAAISLLFINAGYELFDILAWVLFAKLSQREGETPLRLFGLGVASMFAGMALGNLAGNVLESLLIGGEAQVGAVAVLAIVSLVAVVSLVMPEGVIAQLARTVLPEKAQDEDGPTQREGEPNRPTLERRCELASQTFGLTPRESEVIVLLARGRTLAIIARDLQIAKGTARTHIENIYRKLDVHKQQELIDLVESMEG